MGIDAGIKIKFLDAEGKVIDADYMDCYKFSANCQRFSIPEGTKEFIVCFSTEEEKCSECDASSNDSSSHYSASSSSDAESNTEEIVNIDENNE